MCFLARNRTLLTILCQRMIFSLFFSNFKLFVVFKKIKKSTRTRKCSPGNKSGKCDVQKSLVNYTKKCPRLERWTFPYHGFTVVTEDPVRVENSILKFRF